MKCGALTVRTAGLLAPRPDGTTRGLTRRLTRLTRALTRGLTRGIMRGLTKAAAMALTGYSLCPDGRFNRQITLIGLLHLFFVVSSYFLVTSLGYQTLDYCVSVEVSNQHCVRH